MQKIQILYLIIFSIGLSLAITSCSEKEFEEIDSQTKIVEILKETSKGDYRIVSLDSVDKSYKISLNNSKRLVFDKSITPVFSFDDGGNWTINGEQISLSQKYKYQYNEYLPTIERCDSVWSIDSYDTDILVQPLSNDIISVSHIFIGKRTIYFFISDGTIIDVLKSPIVTQKKYFISETDRIASSIKNLCQGKDCFVLAQLTDIHEKSGVESFSNRTKQTFTNVFELCNKVSLDGVIFLGDALWPDDEKTYSNLEHVNKYYDSVISNLLSIHDKSYFMLGNHDGQYGSIPNSMATYESQFAKMDPYIEREAGMPWYYFDNDRSKVRCIILSVPDPVNKNSVWEYSEEQLKWLSETALNTKDGWNVLIFSHTHPYNVAGNSPLKNHASIAGILNAYNSHSSYSDNLISVDYSRYSSTTIAAMFVGHAHEDNIINKGDKYFKMYDLTFPTIVTDKCMTYGNDKTINISGGITQERRTNTVTQELWDVIVFNPSNKEIHMVRFGAGEDRKISL